MSLREPRCLVCGAPLDPGAPFQSTTRQSEVCSDECHARYLNPDGGKLNENCLEGLQCPECGSLEPFWIHAECKVLMTDAGSEQAIEFEWEDHSHIECKQCGHGAQVKHFRTA